MAASTLINHRGARTVEEGELALIPAPPATDTWFPIPHNDVLRSVKETLSGAGFQILKQRLSVANDDHRFFGTLDLGNRIADGITLAVGIRNSTDKTFPIGFCCGNRCFVCDNLAFTSEIVVSKKHTRFGQERYLEGLSTAVSSLGQYQQTAAKWIEALRNWTLSREEADSIILRAYEEEIVGPRLLPLIIKEWREPSFEEYRPRNGWSLWNAFTACLRTRQESQPAAAALTTIRLQRLLSPEVIDGSVVDAVAL